MKTSMARRVIVVLAFVVMVVVNALANIIPINGLTTGEVANQFNVYFFPAAYVFSIWSLIYVLLFAFVIYQVLPRNKENNILSALAWPFVATCLANAIWIVCWHYQLIGLSLLLMVVLLLLLIIIYRKLVQGMSSASQAEQFFIQLPFSIYLAWIAVATIANVSVFLWNLDWDGFGIPGPVWSTIMMAVAAALGILILMQKKDIAFSLVLIWALAGIAVRFPDIEIIVWSALTVVAVLVAACLVTLFSRPAKNN